ncbi:site-specific integrase, partial [Sphingomonas aestuarii]
MFEKVRKAAGQIVDKALFESFDPAIEASPQAALEGSRQSPFRAQVSSRTIGEVYDRYVADPKHTWSKRTAISHTTTRRWVVETFGEQTPLTEITREGCRQFVDLLRNMPSHADKRYPDLEMKQAVAAAKAKGEHRLINTANVNAYLNRFGGLMNWAINEGYIDRNPLKGLKLPDPVKRRDKRKPFSNVQLSRIFNAPIYIGCENDEQGYALAGCRRPRRARFWVPLIALFSGLRLNEICQLEVSDIQQSDGIACFKIAEGVSQTGEEKRLKTRASERIVPVHNQLIRFGFLAFAEMQRSKGESHLFPELPLGHLGYRSTSFSRWFSRFLKTVDAAAPLTCFHSFRHNFRDGLRDARVDRDVALYLGGWTSDGKMAAVADNYGSGYSVSVLAEALNSINFPALNLDHLSAIETGR